MVKLLCIIALLLPGLTAAQPTANADKLYKEALALATNYRDGEAVLKFEEVVSVNPSHFQSLCQLVMLKTSIGSRTSDEAKKMDYFHEAKEHAIKAYELRPNDAQANYVMALGIGGVAMVSSTREKIAYAYEMRDFLDKALKLNPSHAESWHLLGRWHYKIANLSFAEVAAANMFFGGIPEGASNQAALDCLNKAIQFAPKEILYYYDLARVYHDLDDDIAASEALRNGLNLKVTTSDELEVQRRCRALLREIDKY